VEQRRLLLVVVISLVILVSYNELVLKRYRRLRPAAAPGAPAESLPPAAAQGAPQKPSSDLEAPTDGQGMIVVETDLVRATITPVGARLKELRLKQYRHTVEPESETLNLVQDASILPITFQLGPDASDAAVLYKADRTDLHLSGSERVEITFTGETQTGVHLEKRFIFTGDNYLFLVEAKVSGPEAPKTVGLIMTPMPLDHTSSAAREVAIGLEGHTLVQATPADLPTKPKELQSTAWSGFGVQYFLAAGVPVPPPSPSVMSAAAGLPIVRIDNPIVDGQAKFAVFMGPKAPDVLASAGLGLDRAIDFGWFWFVAIPLLQGMKWLHTVTGNYGVSIILLTTLVKVATIPLTQTTFRNMREMQRIQPQIQKLRDRFKDDQVALQKETMELYKRHHVNPLAGCLPMVLQLPIFVGLYNALQHAIELRHAPFALWINDLSAPDRLMVAGVGIPVLTIFMGISMFVQQWFTPQQGDPVQQRMMMIMPLVFTFMFINFPAGLVLYWLVNNILTIGQQYWMMRRFA
jgi:YidC/Oxa1 family membrane protein insertase